MATPFQRPLNDAERVGVVLAVRATFARLRDLQREVEPIYQRFGFSTPPPSVMARELAGPLETAIAQHVPSFSLASGEGRLQRDGRRWEVRLSRDAPLTVHTAHPIAGDNFIVVNYQSTGDVSRIWTLRDAQDHLFSTRRGHSSTRVLIESIAASRIETLFEAVQARSTTPSSKMAKAALQRQRSDRRRLRGARSTSTS